MTRPEVCYGAEDRMASDDWVIIKIKTTTDHSQFLDKNENDSKFERFIESFLIARGNV